MTAINHALTGAIIGLTASNPILAIPLAFVSHFLLDALPHYDVPGASNEAKIDSGLFLWLQIVAGAVLCFLLVVLLAVRQPRHWVVAAVCAFVAASPDLLSIPRFISVKRGGPDLVDRNAFWRFHHNIQWKTAPRFAAVEILWFAGACMLLWQFL
jgi:hypothetical protein